MVALKTQLAKREEQRRAQGDELSPAKPAASSDEPPSGSQNTLPLQMPGPSVPQDRPQPGTLDHLENIERGILKTKIKQLTGPSIETSQAWVKGFKKTLGAQKFEELQTLVDEVYKASSDETSQMSIDRLKQLAVKFGIPIVLPIAWASDPFQLLWLQQQCLAA